MPNTRDALLENIRYISSQISFVIKTATSKIYHSFRANVFLVQSTKSFCHKNTHLIVIDLRLGLKNWI